MCYILSLSLSLSLYIYIYIYPEDSRRLQDLVRSIQQHTAQIRKETSLLSTAMM